MQQQKVSLNNTMPADSTMPAENSLPVKRKFPASRNRLKRVGPGDVLITALLLLFALTIILPFYYTMVVSVTPENVFYKSTLLIFPKVIDLYSYKVIFSYPMLGRSFLNSFIIVVLGVAYNMFLTTTMAYGFSKKEFPGRELFFNIVLFTMYFGGGLIPFYLVIKSLGLTNTLAVLILPTGLSTFYMIIVKGFFQELPGEIRESARIDGASELKIFFRIVLPLSLPVLATFSLFYAVDRWNEWFHAMIFINNKTKYPIQLTLREILGQTTIQDLSADPGAMHLDRKTFSEGVKMASVVVIMGPVMLIYPFLQKYFIKGVMIGAIKA